MDKRFGQGGWTLVEILVGTVLLIGGGGAVLLGMNSALIHADYLSQFQVAMNAAQGELEQLSALPFDTLWSGVEFANARANGQRVELPPELAEGLPGGAIAIKIRSADLRNPTNPALLDLYVAACWQSRGRRIGEDQNCNGQLDPGEDGATTLNPVPNGWIDSPAMVSTRIARRD